MIVEPLPLPDSRVVAMRAASSDPLAGITAGEVLGYYCADCCQCDETLTQIVHGDDCPLAGEHGRAVYGDDLAIPSFDHDSRGELRPDTRFSVLQWSGTLPEYGIVHNDFVGFRCDECANLDEHLFEIVHDEECHLSHPTNGETARAKHDEARYRNRV